MEKIRLNWHIISDEEDNVIRRYCHNCGKAAMFRDSGIRRHNANGKNIHAYAIYKCDNDHTWNNKLAKYKAQSNDTQPKTNQTAAMGPPSFEKISLADLQQQGILEIEIQLVTVQGKWRLDKLLTQHLSGVSRSEIANCINRSSITLDGKRVKSSERVREGQIVRILL